MYSFAQMLADVRRRRHAGLDDSVFALSMTGRWPRMYKAAHIPISEIKYRPLTVIKSKLTTAYRSYCLPLYFS